MGFVCEIVPENDHAFFNAMRRKNPFGKGYIYVTKHSRWCADRERNAFLVPLGGGMHDTPYFIDLWLDGFIVTIEAEQYGKRINNNVVVGWNVVDIRIPSKIWDKKELIISMIEESLTELHPNDSEAMLKPKVSCECRIDENTIMECISE